MISWLLVSDRGIIIHRDTKIYESKKKDKKGLGGVAKQPTRNISLPSPEAPGVKSPSKDYTVGKSPVK